jgi:hypothetical protein
MEVGDRLHDPAASSPGKVPMDGPQSRSGRYGEQRNLPPAGNRTSAGQPIAQGCTSTDSVIPTRFVLDFHK